MRHADGRLPPRRAAERAQRSGGSTWPSAWGVLPARTRNRCRLFVAPRYSMPPESRAEGLRWRSTMRCQETSDANELVGGGASVLRGLPAARRRRLPRRERLFRESPPPRDKTRKRHEFLAYRIGPSSVGDFFAPSIPLVRHIISAPSAPPAAATSRRPRFHSPNRRDAARPRAPGARLVDLAFFTTPQAAPPGGSRPVRVPDRDVPPPFARSRARCAASAAPRRGSHPHRREAARAVCRARRDRVRENANASTRARGDGLQPTRAPRPADARRPARARRPRECARRGRRRGRRRRRPRGTSPSGERRRSGRQTRRATPRRSLDRVLGRGSTGCRHGAAASHTFTSPDAPTDAQTLGARGFHATACRGRPAPGPPTSTRAESRSTRHTSDADVPT